MFDRGALFAIVGVFAPLSLVSFGGGPSIMAAMQHQSVALHHWMTGSEFVDLFAISRAAPGPGTLIAALIGYHVAGWLGALAAVLALFVPSSIIVYGAAVLWRRHEHSLWRPAVERGLVPVAVGLILAGVLTIIEAGNFGILQLATTAVATALLLWRNVSPYLLLGGAAGLYLVLAAL